MNEINVVAVVGNLGTPSRAQQLAQTIVAELAQQAPLRAQLIELLNVAPSLLRSLDRESLPDDAQAALASVERADLLVVSTPVYRASYSGLFKHFFDFIERDALTDVPVILAAAGGSDRHALVIEHALRPLFSFFGAQTVPTTLYASDADFGGHSGVTQSMTRRAQRAAQQALQLVRVSPSDLLASPADALSTLS